MEGREGVGGVRCQVTRIIEKEGRFEAESCHVQTFEPTLAWTKGGEVCGVCVQLFTCVLQEKKVGRDETFDF